MDQYKRKIKEFAITNLSLKISQIIEDFKSINLIVGVNGDTSRIIQRISAIEDCKDGDLVFMDKADYVSIIAQQRPACVVTTEKVKALLPEDDRICYLLTPYVPLAHALIRQRYAGRDYNETGWSDVHPSAVIHSSVELGEGCVIEPKVVIGKNVILGKNVRVMAGTVIENDVRIGEESIIHPSCVIGYGSQLGNRVVVGAGSIIGSEGFGFAQDAKRKSYPIPQTGIVVLEDDVRLGANNCIDRAAFKETRIGSGTKLDNLCHVAHNVQIGEDCLLTAMLCVAGSTKIGNRVITSGQTGILDHLNISDDTVFLHRAGVTKDIEKPGAYAGLPLQPLTEYMKNSVVMKSAVELKKRVSELEKQIFKK